MTKPHSPEADGFRDCPPKLVTDPRHLAVLKELMQREPLFHRPEFGTTRADFENMTEATYWEVGASGRRYNRECVLTEVVKRYENPEYHGINSSPENAWETRDSHCLELAPDNYLLTYTLIQGGRITRRSTIWRRHGRNWKIVYHQGTVAADG